MIIDVNIDVTRYLSRLKEAGVDTIIGYLDPIGPHNSKVVSPARAKAIANAGLRLGLVNEGWGDFAHGGVSAGAGERDGEYAANAAANLGTPKNACVYFAVDTDASSWQINKLVLPYFSSINRAFKGKNLRIGVYGSGDVCAAVIGEGLADLSWLSCSLGWSGSHDYLNSKKWSLRQHVPTHYAGVPCDTDDANGDFGDFVPFAATVTA